MTITMGASIDRATGQITPITTEEPVDLDALVWMLALAGHDLAKERA